MNIPKLIKFEPKKALDLRRASVTNYLVSWNIGTGTQVDQV